MEIRKQTDGTWAVLNGAGHILGIIDGRYDGWVARAGNRTLGVCRSRLSAEILIRAHTRSASPAQLSGN